MYTYDPRDEAQPLKLVSKKPVGRFRDFAMKEGRFAMLTRSKPDRAEKLFELSQADIEARWRFYEQLAAAGATGEEPAGDGNGKQSTTTKEVEA